MYFIWEREAIRLARLNGHAAPWTVDPVLARYKFTNIRREDDRISEWVRYNVSEVCEPEELWFTLLIARLVNWPPTLRRLLSAEVIPCSPSGFDAEAFVRVVESCKGITGKVYGPAYVVYPGKLGHANKSEFLAHKVLFEAADNAGLIAQAEASNSVENVVLEMAQGYGVSTFMAGQVAADLTYGYSLSRAVDLYSWAPMGSGSLRGLNYLHNRTAYAGWSQENFNAALMQVNSDVRAQLDITDLTLHDVQNCLCEYGKYVRAALGQGNPKTLYKPETEF